MSFQLFFYSLGTSGQMSETVVLSSVVLSLRMTLDRLRYDAMLFLGHEVWGLLVVEEVALVV
jgi:hypothetical protein